MGCKYYWLVRVILLYKHFNRKEGVILDNRFGVISPIVSGNFKQAEIWTPKFELSQNTELHPRIVSNNNLWWII